MIYVICNKTFSVAVDSFGAELNSIKKDGKELLWQNQDGSWAGHSPVLFPFCGRCSVTVAGKTYSAPQHGIAKSEEFIPVFQSEKELSLNFRSNERTKKAYPYEFSLTITYKVRGTTLYVDYAVENLGNAEMFYGVGGHESFNVDGDLCEYKVEFEKEETLKRFYHDDDGYLTGKTEVLPKSKYLSFKNTPIKNSETLIFADIKSGWCKLVGKGGKVVAKTYFKGFNNILFWRPNDAKMVCIEPWSNLPDKLGESKDFREKSGIYALPAGEKTIISRKIKY